MMDRPLLTYAQSPASRPRQSAGGHRRMLAGVLLAVLGPALLAASVAAQVQRGTVSGRIVGAPEGTPLAGTRVVLMQFRLGEDGVPKGEPLQTQTIGEDGRYAFANVPLGDRSVLQVGATVAGQVVGSHPFTFPPEQSEVMLDLRVPRVVPGDGALRIDEGLIAVEPMQGGVWITEVLHLLNPGQDVIEGVQRPLELRLPEAAEGLELVRGIQEQDGFQRLGGKLLIYGNLAPGRTTVAFRYRLPVWLGRLQLDKRYPHAIGTLSVLSPEGNLHLRGAGFAPKETQTIEGTRYDAWAAMQLPAGEDVAIELRGIPMRQELFLAPAGVFLLAMVGVVVWFLRRRLPAASAQAAG